MAKLKLHAVLVSPWGAPALSLAGSSTPQQGHFGRASQEWASKVLPPPRSQYLNQCFQLETYPKEMIRNVKILYMKKFITAKKKKKKKANSRKPLHK